MGKYDKAMWGPRLHHLVWLGPATLLLCDCAQVTRKCEMQWLRCLRKRRDDADDASKLICGGLGHAKICEMRLELLMIPGIQIWVIPKCLQALAKIIMMIRCDKVYTHVQWFGPFMAIHGLSSLIKSIEPFLLHFASRYFIIFTGAWDPRMWVLLHFHHFVAAGKCTRTWLGMIIPEKLGSFPRAPHALSKTATINFV